MKALAVLPMLLLMLTAPASAADPVDAGWSEVAFARDGDCALSITGNGQFYRIAASGLEPGSAARYILTNGDMKPLDWQVRADAGGQFARYYLPFRWHRTGDTVTVSLAGANCRLAAAFDWRRATFAER